MGKPSKAAIAKYNQANYDRLQLVVPKGCKEQIKNLASASGCSVNAFILGALEEKTGLKLVLDGELPTLKKHEQPTTEQPTCGVPGPKSDEQ